MADYLGLNFLLNTAVGMTEIVGSRQDDNTNTLTGVDWFKFNGVAANPLYVSANSWYGFGSASEHLQLYRRDGSMYKLYRQEGTLWHGYYNFLKLRFDGYTYYNSEGSSHRLIYELFLISDGRLMLNIITSPSDGDMGTSRINADSTVSIPVGRGGSYQFICTPADATTGRNWSVSEEPLVIDEPYATGFLIQDGSGNTYTVNENALEQISGGLTKQNFIDYGVADFDSSLLLTLTSPKVFYWHDSQDDLPILRMKVGAVPLIPQLVVFNTVTLSKDINYIRITGDDDSLWNVSFDNGSTWYKYSGGSWVLVSSNNDGSKKGVLGTVTKAKWAEKCQQGDTVKFRVWLIKNGYVKSITLLYEGG